MGKNGIQGGGEGIFEKLILATKRTKEGMSESGMNVD
jgi:hypothetical protein